ncbi:class I SAM-dependent methyltransferase [Pseudorhodoferax sp.]|uniref:class I SAM-dependent methyltransferase n=1 Tax=Pseudorhodoferax sp. TaxID=1993553 RepID=UPI002DD67411|nr:class I SAM-dependent methyltransferase [Pseudorhodoferax sp.]
MPRLPWPLPAVLVWVLAWGVFKSLLLAGAVPWLALLLASATGGLASVLGTTLWRRLLMALGFPLALLLGGAAGGAAWLWLVPLAVLALVYPLNAWRDAPLFPTPADALAGLAGRAPLPPGAQVLDAGCGLGHGLQALHWTYPQAKLHGVEWSWPLRLVCGLRCPWARVRQGDMWRADWRPFALVYLFQRPESMARAVAKAQAELAPGAWLVSLEFEATVLRPTARLQGADGRPVWLYQQPFTRA